MRFLPSILLFLPSLVLGQKVLSLSDKAYEPQIKSVQFYPDQRVEGNMLFPSATRIEAQNLVLEFDDLQDQKNNYYAKLVHCNFDWTKSTLMDLDFMREY